MEKCPVYSFCRFKGIYSMYIHIQIPKVPCFACLSDCYGIRDKYLSIFGYFLIFKY